MKNFKILILVVGIVLLSLFLQLFLSQTGLWINLTSSMPPGIYVQEQSEIKRNDYVISCLPKEVASISYQRGYLGYGNCYLHTAPVGKKLVAMEGDLAQIDYNGIRVNGKLIKGTKPSAFDGKGRIMEIKQFKRKLAKNEILLALENPRSYDSRYFGAISDKELQAKIVPLYLF